MWSKEEEALQMQKCAELLCFGLLCLMIATMMILFERDTAEQKHKQLKQHKTHLLQPAGHMVADMCIQRDKIQN